MQQFEFRTLEDVRLLSERIAALFAQPVRTRRGLHELMVNAVEHGNLGISYAEKSRLLLSGQWMEEVKRRLEMQAYMHHVAIAEVAVVGGNVELTITDAGDGFDWRPYMGFDENRSVDLHGRGIAIACAAGVFEEVRYVGSGNSVLCRGIRAKNSDVSINGFVL
jgi:hypothetical protein